MLCDYSLLVTLYKIVVNFRFPGFPIKAENESFTAAGSRCNQHLKCEKFQVVIWQTSSKNCTKKRAARAARFIFPYSTNHVIDLWRCGVVFGGRLRRRFSNSLGGEIRDTKTLNLWRNIVSLQVLGRCLAIFTLRDQPVA